MEISAILDQIGTECDPEEESFLLFSQPIPSQNLGFVDAKATILEITIGNRDFTIHQSPTILSSNRDGGTTGAVLWKITPLLATWLTTPTNPLFKHNLLSTTSHILELGSGISGLAALSLGGRVASYTLTDQAYTLKLLNKNLAENASTTSLSPTPTKTKSKSKSKWKTQNQTPLTTSSDVETRTLDWETDDVRTALSGRGTRGDGSFDAVVACDCVYNDALIGPFVQACVEVCALRCAKDDGEGDGDGDGDGAGDGNGDGDENRRDRTSSPTLCIVAQQLRSAEVFEAWLLEFSRRFRVWRVGGDEALERGLGGGGGFVVHVGILRL